MRWSAICERFSETVHHYKFSDSNGGMLTFEEAIGLWSSGTAEGRQFRAFTSQTLVNSPFATIRWETPVVDLNRKDREFEFVLLNSPGLDRRENRRPFNKQINAASADELAIVFSNLGRDAVLIVPTPRPGEGNASGELSSLGDVTSPLGDPDASGEGRSSIQQLGGDVNSAESVPAKVNYCHLASFLRSASAEQADELWRNVGTAMVSRLSSKPVWLNTAGGGVAWLHIRLDDRPKYYGYQPFKEN